MGAIASPIVAGLSFLSPAVKTVTGLANAITGSSHQHAQQELALSQLKAQQKLAARQAQAQADLDRAKIAADTETAEQQRRDALRRAVARQQAQFGASGIDTGESGSAQAVMLGLFQDSDEDLAARQQMDALRNQAIDLSQANQQSLNVLQRTQLQERQKLAQSFSF